MVSSDRIYARVWHSRIESANAHALHGAADQRVQEKPPDYSVFSTQRLVEAAVSEIIIALFSCRYFHCGGPVAPACIGRHESIDTADGADLDQRVRRVGKLVRALLRNPVASAGSVVLVPVSPPDADESTQIKRFVLRELVCNPTGWPRTTRINHARFRGPELCTANLLLRFNMAFPIIDFKENNLSRKGSIFRNELLCRENSADPIGIHC